MRRIDTAMLTELLARLPEAPKHGETLALGCNEVPKAGGGTYWEGDTGDARDAALGEDQNARRKRLMVTDIVYRLAKAEFAPERFSKSKVADLEAELIDGPEAPLRDCLILDSLEFGRMLHAEMCAIMEAAKLGIPLRAVLHAFPLPQLRKAHRRGWHSPSCISSAFLEKLRF
jgi:deoxycytidylate deaminase